MTIRLKFPELGMITSNGVFCFRYEDHNKSKIVDKKFLDSYDFDPLVVDLVEKTDHKAPEYSEEYEELKIPIFRAFSNEELEGYPTDDEYNPRHVKITHYRHAHEGEVKKYLVSHGTFDAFGDEETIICAMCDIDPNRLENIYKYWGALYEYNYQEKKYVKKFANGCLCRIDGEYYYLLDSKSDLLLSQL